MEFRAVVGEHGRIILPVKIRKELNIEAGDRIVLMLDNKELHIRTLKDAVKNYQAMIKAKNVNNISLVDSLKQSRKEEAEDE